MNELTFMTKLLCDLYRDVVGAFPAQYQVEAERDIAVLTARARWEGTSFFTKTLPSLAKAIDTALAQGTTLQAPSFSRRKGSKLPKFMGWLIGMVLDSKGHERSDASALALKQIRLILYTFYKYEIPVSEESNKKLLDTFVDVDKRLLEPWNLTDTHAWVLRNARKLVARVLANADPREIIPRHGPGSVATGERPSQKLAFARFCPQMDEVYPYTEYFFYSPSHLCDELRSNKLPDVRTQPHRPVAKVVLVPKDSRANRLISMEPLETQWLQQGQMALLVETLENHPLTRGHVNFSSQEINRELALRSSKGEIPYVTLDMAEASDRVSLQLVQILFPLNWVECLEATRSRSTVLPDGREVPLAKFAPMGSAVCFPVEALCFWALIVSTSMYTGKTLRQAVSDVYVYGDDIITTLENYEDSLGIFTAVGLKFNASKCCISGSFRESCGLDAFKGEEVTPLRIKERFSHRPSIQTALAWTAYSNAYYQRGCYRASTTIERWLRRHYRIPTMSRDTGVLAFVRPHLDAKRECLLHGVRTRYNLALQCLEVQTHFARPQVEFGDTSWRALFTRMCQKSRTVRDLRRDEFPRPLRGPIEYHKDELLRWSKSCEGTSLEVGSYPLPRRVFSKRGWTPLAI